MLRFLPTNDEREQQTNYRALTFAFTGTLIFSAAIGFLQSLGLHPVSWLGIPALMIILWSIGRSVTFAKKVVEKKHASSKEYLRHGRVFHLLSRNLYEAIGRENVRFRRAHSTEYIRTRLTDLPIPVLRS